MATCLLSIARQRDTLFDYGPPHESTYERQSLHSRQLYLPLNLDPPSPARSTHPPLYEPLYCSKCCVSNTLHGYSGVSSLRLCNSCDSKFKSYRHEIDYEESGASSPGIRPIFSGFQSCVSDTFRNNEYYPDLCRGITDIQNWRIGSCSVKREVSLDTSTIMMEGRYEFHGQIVTYLDTEVTEYNHRSIWPFGIQENTDESLAVTSNTREFVYLMQTFYTGAYTGPMVAKCSVSNSEGGFLNVSIPFAPSESYDLTFKDQGNAFVPDAPLLSKQSESCDPQTFTILESLECNEPHKHIERPLNEKLSTGTSGSSHGGEGEDYCGVSSTAHDDGSLSTTVC